MTTSPATGSRIGAAKGFDASGSWFGPLNLDEEPSE